MEERASRTYLHVSEAVISANVIAQTLLSRTFVGENIKMLIEQSTTRPHVFAMKIMRTARRSLTTMQIWQLWELQHKISVEMAQAGTLNGMRRQLNIEINGDPLYKITLDSQRSFDAHGKKAGSGTRPEHPTINVIKPFWLRAMAYTLKLLASRGLIHSDSSDLLEERIVDSIESSSKSSLQATVMEYIDCLRPYDNMESLMDDNRNKIEALEIQSKLLAAENERLRLQIASVEEHMVDSASKYEAELSVLKKEIIELRSVTLEEGKNKLRSQLMSSGTIDLETFAVRTPLRSADFLKAFNELVSIGDISLDGMVKDQLFHIISTAQNILEQVDLVNAQRNIEPEFSLVEMEEQPYTLLRAVQNETRSRPSDCKVRLSLKGFAKAHRQP